jgi:formylglycine-generating enzyme required for sulfatase activity
MKDQGVKVAGCALALPLVLAAALGGCPRAEDLKEITDFRFEAAKNPRLTEDVSGVIGGTAISAVVPCLSNRCALVASFECTGVSVRVGSKVQVSGETVNDFRWPQSFVVLAEDGSTAEYTVTVSSEAAPLVEVAGGTFEMGSTTADLEKPVHTVTVSSFRIGKYEVTQSQYEQVLGPTVFCYTGDTSRPAEWVTWHEAVRFCNELSESERLEPCYTINGSQATCDWSKNGYRLPTEAEWEFAARGGTLSEGYLYSGSDTADQVAWYNANCGGSTHSAGTKAANELGLHDLSGNVSEWCWDWIRIYPSSAQTDPTGPASGSYRVLRGGSLSFSEDSERCAYRDHMDPAVSINNLGFRIARRAD